MKEKSRKESEKELFSVLSTIDKQLKQLSVNLKKDPEKTLEKLARTMDKYSLDQILECMKKYTKKLNRK